MATQGQQDIHGVAGMHANVNVWPEIADPRYDWHRRQGADPRDPRCVGAPCLGNHQTIKRGSNQHAAYYKCENEECQLRILYVPRAGAPGDRRKAHPLPADLTGLPEPEAPAMPCPVPGMTQPEPQQISRYVGSRYKERPDRRVPCGKQTSAAPPPPPPSQSKSAPKRSTPAPPASTPPSATGASSSTGPAPPSSTPAASPTPDVAQALGQIMEGINAMNVRLNQTEQASRQAAETTVEVAQRVLNLEARAGQTEQAVGQTIQHATQVEAYLTAAASTASGGLPQPVAATPTPLAPTQEQPAPPVQVWHIPDNDPNRSLDVAVPIGESDDELSSIEQNPEL